MTKRKSKTEKSPLQSLFSSIDFCAEKCAEVEHLLAKREGSKGISSCISLCRDFTDLGAMLGIFALRKSLFAIHIAQLLHDISTQLLKLLMQLNQPEHEIVECIEALKICITKINQYNISERNRGQ